MYSLGTIELLNCVLKAVTEVKPSESTMVLADIDYSKLWDVESFDDSDYWFLKTGVYLLKICFSCTLFKLVLPQAVKNTITWLDY